MVEKIALLIASISLLSTIGLTTWMYKIMEIRIAFLKEDIEKLKASENRWMVRYRKIVSLIINHRECTPGVPCKIHEQYVNMIEDEGVT